MKEGNQWELIWMLLKVKEALRHLKIMTTQLLGKSESSMAAILGTGKLQQLENLERER
jgi:hypothetical protein